MAFITKQLDTGDTVLEATGSSVDTGAVKVSFAENVEVGFGRGATDTDITYVTLRNGSGTLYYVYMNGTTLTASTTKP